jgi:branched-chain amino acid transport system substrate-binding protein
VLAVGLGACGSSSSSSSSSNASAAAGGGSSSHSSGGSGPIIIGHAGAQTGLMKIYDAPVDQGLKMAAAEVNAQGGVLGHKIKIIEGDTQSSVSQARVVAQQLLNQGANFLVPSCDYDFGGPAAQVANQHKTIAITCAGGPLMGFQGSGPYTFNVYAGSPTEGAVDADFAALKKGWKKAFVIDDPSLAYTKDVCSNFVKEYEADGGTIAGEVTMQNSDTSITSQVNKLQQSGAPFLMLCSYPPGGISALRQIRGAGFRGPVIGSGAFDGMYWTNTVPGISDFYIAASGSIAPDNPNPGLNTFLANFKKFTGGPPVSMLYPMSGYEVVQSLVTAIKAAHSTDPDKVKQALENFHGQPLLFGPTTYSSSCHVPVGRPLLIEQYTNGKEHYSGVTIRPKNVPDKTC